MECCLLTFFLIWPSLRNCLYYVNHICGIQVEYSYSKNLKSEMPPNLKLSEYHMISQVENTTRTYSTQLCFMHSHVHLWDPFPRYFVMCMQYSKIKKKSEIQNILVPGVLNKGYSTCINLIFVLLLKTFSGPLLNLPPTFNNI